MNKKDNKIKSIVIFNKDKDNIDLEDTDLVLFKKIYVNKNKFGRLLLVSLLFLCSLIIILGIYCSYKITNYYRTLEISIDGDLKTITSRNDVDDNPFQDDVNQTYAKQYKDGVQTDEILKDDSMIKYTSNSGVTYWFGLNSAVLDQGSMNPLGAVNIILNPMHDYKGQLEFYFLPNYGQIRFSSNEELDGADLNNKSIGCLFLNENFKRNVSFKSIEDYGVSLYLPRDYAIDKAINNWDLNVIVIDTTTNTIKDSLKLNLNEYNEKGKIIKFKDTELRGWWRIDGVTNNLLDISSSKFKTCEALITAYNTGNIIIEGIDPNNLVYIQGRQELYTPNYFIYEEVTAQRINSNAIFKYSTYIRDIQEVYNIPASLIAITPIYETKDSPIITLYGVKDINQNEEEIIRYIGFSDYNEIKHKYIGT